ncbi:conserved hypothetical protein [Ricinus communis]|uniref:Uncharacterized protein n=1 Tax=Ricinus communis TaxID=3988 RepID=B9SUU4_RICCO|nr:conserved hypothetical protein [Ricinus communis]
MRKADRHQPNQTNKQLLTNNVTIDLKGLLVVNEKLEGLEEKTVATAGDRC